MWRWLKRKLRQRRARKRLEALIHPRVLAALATEVTDLARALGAVEPVAPDFHAKLARIMGEMEELLRLLERPEFRKLSSRRRILLRKSLLTSREQLLDSVQAAPPPTRLVQ